MTAVGARLSLMTDWLAMPNGLSSMAGSILITDNFNSHFHSFEVCSPETEVKVIKGFYKLAECEPLWVLETFFKDSPSFVCLRHVV